MPTPPAVSPVTGKPVPPHYIHSSSLHFQDTSGRSLLLRGVNLSGGAKAPHNQPSWSADNFWEAAEAGRGDYVGRPLNLEDGSADVHLARLRAWGFNFLRFVFTWEALEHEGPGKYDQDYIEYVVKVLLKCKEWGFRVFMDPHQDVWSRFSGGSGAPLWTLYACGIDPKSISPTFSALLHHEYPSREEPKPSTFPQMIWATNYTRLLSQTVFTLFFAGKTYAPKCIIDGVNIQDYLQNHFLDAVGALADRIGREPGLYDEVVIGWDSMNEPGNGFVENKDLSVIPKDQRLKKGPSPTPFEGMRLGMGEAVDVTVWDFTQMGPKSAGMELLDPKGTKLWLRAEDEVTRGGGKWGWKRGEQWQMGTCIWAQHGVWDPATSTLLRPDYFVSRPSDPTTKVNFVADFWRLHWFSYASRVRLHHPEAIHFIQPPVFEIPPSLPESFLKGRACTSPHYYDGLTLMTKHWNWFNADALGLLRHKYWSVVQALKIGETAIRRCIQDQMGILKKDTTDVFGTYPTIIGEIGCPFDMDGKKAYGYVDGGQGEGDYSSQEKAWDCSLNATDGKNCINYTMWTYVPDNMHQWGDLWNGEDLSIWSQDDAQKIERYRNGGQLSAKSSSSRGGQQDTQATTDSSSPSSSTTLLPPSEPSSSSYTLKSIQSGEGVTASLILDGARAIGAVCRPYPMATVGTPQRIDFDIASTSFRLEIRVQADDLTRPSDGEELATEIYAPFVHYAASLAPLSTTQSSNSVETPKTALLAGSSVNAAPLKLDVDIHVSNGSFYITGQTVRWSYPAPVAGEAVYTFEMKRTGGALHREMESVRQGSWWEVCSGCVIA